MITDNLDKLTDAELSEVFAVEVAKWRRDERYPIYWIPPGKKQLKAAYWTEKPDEFATDANAVLPWLEKTTGYSACYDGLNGPESHQVTLDSGPGAETAFAPTFARAACIALIRAERAKKEAGKASTPPPA